MRAQRPQGPGHTTKGLAGHHKVLASLQLKWELLGGSGPTCYCSAGCFHASNQAPATFHFHDASNSGPRGWLARVGVQSTNPSLTHTLHRVG